MLPRLRVNRTRSPLAEASKISPPSQPLKSMRVGAVLAFDCVAAVAGVPLEHVVAGAQEGDVVALLAVDEVVAIAAQQQVDAVAAEDRVVARAAIDGDLDQGGQVARGREAVVAAVGIQHEILGGADVDREGCWVNAIETDARAIRRRGENFVAAAAVDFDGVGAGAAFVEVGIIAGVPDHPIDPRLAKDLIIVVAAGERVVIGAAEQQIEAALAKQRIVPRLAEK